MTSEDSDQTMHSCSLISLPWSHVSSAAYWPPNKNKWEPLPYREDVQAYLSLYWSHRPYCRFCCALAHIRIIELSYDTVVGWLIVLGFNDRSTLVGHFVSSPREKKKRDSRGDESDGQGRNRNSNESTETEEITLPSIFTCYKDSRPCPTRHLRLTQPTLIPLLDIL